MMRPYRLSRFNNAFLKPDSTLATIAQFHHVHALSRYPSRLAFSCPAISCPAFSVNGYVRWMRVASTNGHKTRRHDGDILGAKTYSEIRCGNVKNSSIKRQLLLTKNKI